MAIIYTYPKLQNPQGNELIVVSDVNNKNATRLITIADIASLIPGGGGGGCASAINGILTDNGDYIPPLCNNVTFEGQGIYISADQASSTVTFGVDCTGETPGETPPKIGGIRALNNTTVTDAPGPANEGTYYPIEVLKNTVHFGDCFGVVRVPDSQTYELPCATIAALGGIKVGAVVEGETPVLGSGTATAVQVNDNCQAFVNIPSASEPYVLPCATPTTLGGIKAQNNTTQLSVPPVADTGTYYPIELMKGEDVVTGTDCTAIVRIPSGGNPYVLPCANATTLGGVKAGKVDLETLPPVADEGEYYPIELIESETGPEDNECRAVVKVPSSGGTTPGNGQIDIVAGTGLTGGGSFTVNQAGNSTITLNAQSASGETGWSPMPIYAGNTVLPQQEKDLTMVAHATADATMQINRVKLMLPGTVPGAQGPTANVDAKFAVAVYDGSLTDVINSGANPPLLGEFIYNPLGVAVYGVKEVACTVDAGFAVEAGKDYIVCVSTQAGGPQLWGSGGTNAVQGTTFGFSAFGDSHVGFGNETQDFTAGFPANLGGDPPGIANDFPWGWRYCMHFYFDGDTVETRQYIKCEGVNTVGCEAMPATAVVQAPVSQLLDFLILQDGDNQCCYTKGDEVTAPPSGLTIAGTFTDCDTSNLPRACFEA